MGAACQSDSDCGPNGVCQPPMDLSNGVSPTVWTGGYCTALNCDTCTPCPTGAECFFYPIGGTSENYSLCLADCGTTACRRSGYDCGALGDPMYACLPECNADCDCGPNLVCDNGSCAPPCSGDSDCSAGEILLQLPLPGRATAELLLLRGLLERPDLPGRRVRHAVPGGRRLPDRRALRLGRRLRVKRSR